MKLSQMTFINMYLLTFKIGLTYSWSDVVSLFLHLVTSHPHSLLQTLSFFLQEQSRLLQFVLHLQIIVDVLTFCSKTEKSSQFYDGKFEVNKPVNAELFFGELFNLEIFRFTLNTCIIICCPLVLPVMSIKWIQIYSNLFSLTFNCY